MLTINEFGGINNVAPHEKLGTSELAVAENVDVGLAGEIQRRSGSTLYAEGCYKNVFDAGEYMLSTRWGGELVGWAKGSHPDTAAVTLHEALGIARVWYCTLPDGRTTFSNGLINGITGGKSATSWGVPVPQDFGGVTNVSGELPPGEYRYALSFSRLDGNLEGGAVYSTPFEVTDGGILIQGLPELAGHQLCVYLTPPNSDTAYFAGYARGRAFSFLAGPETLTEPCRTAFMSPPPAGTVTAFWRGRVLTAVGATLFASQHGQWELFDLQRDYKSFSAPITMIQPVVDGVYVGTTQELIFLSGTQFDDLEYSSVLEGRVALGSGVSVPGEQVLYKDRRGSGQAMICIAAGGVVAGFAGGAISRMTHERYITDVVEVAATFREVAGIPQYVAVPL